MGNRKYLVILCLALCGCSAKYHLKKAAEHIAKAELRGAKWHNDSTFVRTPFVVPEIRTDTVIKNTHTRDTVRIVKDRLSIKYVNMVDSVYLEGKCESDTIIKEVPVAVSRTIYAPTKPFPWVWLIISFIAGGLLAWRVLR